MAYGYRDLHANYDYVQAISARRIADSTAISGAIIDMQGYYSVEFLINLGTIADADATFAVTMVHGDAVNNAAAPTTITDAAAVNEDALLGTLAAAGFTFAHDDAIRTIGYVPAKGTGKRYVQLVVTPTGNAGNADLSATAIKQALRLPA